MAKGSCNQGTLDASGEVRGRGSAGGGGGSGNMESIPGNRNFGLLVRGWIEYTIITQCSHLKSTSSNMPGGPRLFVWDPMGYGCQNYAGRGS